MKKIILFILIAACASCQGPKQYICSKRGSVAENGDVPRRFYVRNRGLNMWGGY